MTRWLLYGIFASIVGSLLVLLIAQDAGYILISIGNKTLEMSFWFGLVSFSILAVIVWKCVKLLMYCWDTLAGSVSWLSESRSKRITKRTNRGLIYFIEGNWRAAKKDLLAAARLEKKPLLHYLAAANSAFELGDEEETRFLLHQAEKSAEENELAIFLTQARIEIRAQKFEKALATLQRAALVHPNDPVVIGLLKTVNIKLEAWQAILDLLPKLKGTKTLSKEELADLEILAWRGQLKIAFSKAENMSTDLEESLNHIWKGVPAAICKDASVVALYASKLIEKGLADKALQVLAKTLKTNWNRPLLFLYGSAKGSDQKSQLLQAESWLREHPGDATLMYILGKLARVNQLWGKAQDYLENSVLLKPTQKAYAELASLLADLGKHEESVQCYHKGLTLNQR